MLIKLLQNANPFLQTSVLKLDSEDASKKLEGAKFELTDEGVKAILVNGEVYVKDTEGIYWMLKNGSFTDTAPGKDAEGNDLEGDALAANLATYDNTTEKYSLVGVQSVVDSDLFTSVNKIGYTNSNGELSFTGLNAGTYKLKELAAPKDYNIVNEEINFTISASYDETTGALTGWSSDPAATVVQDKDSDNNNLGTFTVTIENSKGIILPGTGGIGTTLFYTLGSLLIATAAAMVITKKRMEVKEK